MRRSPSNMKLTHQRMIGRYESTPESVLDWLEEQLECRGIDAVVYTRYILSLLQDNDSEDEDLSKEKTGFCCQRPLRKQNIKEKVKPMTTTNKWKHKRYRTTCPDIGHDSWPHSQCCGSNNDTERKLAVVQCLKSASEQEFGIESFVDELCAKLKNIKLLTETVSDSTVSDETSDETTDITQPMKESPKEKALKYYAAFPALDNNSNESTPLISKPQTDPQLIKTSSEICKWKGGKGGKGGNGWNGQKIIEVINNGNNVQPLFDGNQKDQTLENKQNEEKQQIFYDIRDEMQSKQNYFYCEDIESKVMDFPLVVDNQSLNIDYSVDSLDNTLEENDKFERLVNKFNRNIASIWSTSETDVIIKNENIWSFDSSFSSNQSSATVSPNNCSLDLWSSHSLFQSLAEKNGPPIDCWSTPLLKSFNAFSDDGFIDGNHELLDDEKWLNTSHNINKETNRTSLQNHEKNSPFVEFKESLNAKIWNRESDMTQMICLSFVEEKELSNKQISPLVDENLLTSSKTHFQPIRHHSFEKEEEFVSDEESALDLNDKEVNKLIICSEKCPNNNSNTKSIQTSDVSLKLRPISTSFGELASFMGPFNDFEWTNAEYPTQMRTTSEQDQMSDKSTNTENKCSTDLKPKLSSIAESSVETNAENEPEYQDLYQMINEVLRNGITEEDNGITTPLSISLSSTNYGINNNLDNCCSHKQDVSQTTSHSNQCSPHLTTDEILSEELSLNNSLFSKEKSDSIYSVPLIDDYSTLNGINTNGVNTNQILDSHLNLEFRRRHTQNLRDVKYQDHEIIDTRIQKPCTFFIEGNCKRSDCKYSHRINTITCKYWEEGFCFKAEFCPFLHGYDYGFIENEKSFERNICIDESKLYAIESESDFPSLSTTNEDNINDNSVVESEAEFTDVCLEQHFFDFRTKSVTDSNGLFGSSKAKLPMAVFVKKPLKKRKDRNLQ